MSDSGAAFFNANKSARNAAFHFDNDTNADPSGLSPGPLASEVDGDQSARLHPTPGVLGTTQKVTLRPGGYEPVDENVTLERTGRTFDGPVIGAGNMPSGLPGRGIGEDGGPAVPSDNSGGANVEGGGR